MKVAIIGSRKCEHLTVKQVIEAIPKECTSIISGGAIGVDTLAKQAAFQLNIPFKEILPNYGELGKFAPLHRNREIVEQAELIIAFWDYHSGGTKNALLEALRLDKKIKVIMLETSII